MKSYAYKEIYNGEHLTYCHYSRMKVCKNKEDIFKKSSRNFIPLRNRFQTKIDFVKTRCILEPSKSHVTILIGIKYND